MLGIARCSVSILLLSLLVVVHPTQLCAQGQESDPREAEAFFVAQKAFNDGFHDVARGLLERFQKNYPRSAYLPEARLLIGKTYFLQNRFSQALLEFESLAKQRDAAELLDAAAYWTAEVHFKGNNFGKAAQYYEKVIADFPVSDYREASFYSLGWCRMEQERYEEALACFREVEQASRDQPYFKDTPLKITECLYRLRDHAALVAHFQKYEKEFADDPFRAAYNYFYLGESHYYAKNYPEAIAAYEQAVSGGAGLQVQSLASLGIGWSRLRLKEYPLAEQSFSAVNPQDLEKPNRQILKLGEAVLFSQTGRQIEALERYESLIAAAADPLVAIQALLGKAEILYERGDFSGAVSVYSAALEELTAEGITGELLDNAHYGLAWVYLKQGEYKPAISEFQKIVSQTPDKTVKISALCQIADAYQESGDLERARQAYDEILRDYPTSFYSDYVQYQRGMLSLRESNYEGAIMSFMSLKRNFPGSKLIDDASYALGLAYFQRQDYETSREIFAGFQQEFRESSLRSQALYLLGTSLYNLGRFGEALEAFRNVIRYYSGDRDLVQKAEYEMADCYYQLGREKEALSRFEQLRSKYPESSLTAEIIWWLGEYYYRLGDLEMARRYFLALIDDFPESSLIADAYYALGWGYEEEGRHQEAIENFRKVIEIGQQGLSGQAAIAIADIYAKKGMDDSALQVYGEIIGRYPNLSGVVYPQMAQVHEKNGGFEQALQYYRKGLEVVPIKEMARLQFSIAQLYETQGKTEQAIEEYLKVTYLYSQEEDLAVKSLLRVAQIYESDKAFNEAIVLYQRVRELNVKEAAFAQERIESLGSVVQ